MKAKIYTKTGDQGQTALVGGQRISKSHPRLEAYGTLDELNSVFGLITCRLGLLTDAKLATLLKARLHALQNNLFNLGSRLACEDIKMLPQLPTAKADLVTNLEADMDKWESELPQLRNFILPGGSQLASYAHLARTICRRAERACVRLAEESPASVDAVVFLNRLGDWLFLLARKFNAVAMISDVEWEKG